MPNHRNDITPEIRIQIVAESIATNNSPSEMAEQLNVSRQTIYNIASTGKKVLEAHFSPPTEHENQLDSFTIRVDANLIKRFIILLRCIGVTYSLIVWLLREAFSLQISESIVREVVQEAYQKAYLYRSSVSLAGVTHAAFDEANRWGQWLLTGVCCQSLYIFLGEKQPSRYARHWSPVLERLKTKQQLQPQQIVADGWQPLQDSCQKTWEQSRVVGDIFHLRHSLTKVKNQFEGRAYSRMNRAEKAQKALERGATKHAGIEKLSENYTKALKLEEKAINESEVATLYIERAQNLINIIHPNTGKRNDPEEVKKQLFELAEKIAALGGKKAEAAGRYLRRQAQKIVEQRKAFGRVIALVTSELNVSLKAVEKMAWIWELNKEYQVCKKRYRKQELEEQIQKANQVIKREVENEYMIELIRSRLYYCFRQILGASSPVEWANERITSALPMQKRLSSGFLSLRTSFLNLTPFNEGLRKGYTPHELLTGEKIEDWLEKLGYESKKEEVRQFKKLGWRKLVQPFAVTWRENWVGTQPEEEIRKDLSGEVIPLIQPKEPFEKEKIPLKRAA